MSSTSCGGVSFVFNESHVPQVPGLRRIRESKFMTQAELSQKSGVSRVTIVRLEGGGEDARFSTIRKLAHALDVEPGQLVTAA